MKRLTKSIFQIATLLIIAAIIFLFYYFEGHRYLTFQMIKLHREAIMALYIRYKIRIIVAYLLIFIITTSVSLPFMGILTLIGGAIFGVTLGTILVLFAATIGAILSFLTARFLLQDFLEKRYQALLKTFNPHIQQHAFNYMLFLRMFPLMPYVFVNLLLGVTRISFSTYFFGSLIGMIPMTLIFTHAGKQLAQISQWQDIFSINIMLTLSLLAVVSILPMIYKRWVAKKS